MPETEPPWKSPSSDINTRRPSCSKSCVSNHGDLLLSSGSGSLPIVAKQKYLKKKLIFHSFNQLYTFFRVSVRDNRP